MVHLTTTKCCSNQWDATWKCKRKPTHMEHGHVIYSMDGVFRHCWSTTTCTNVCQSNKQQQIQCHCLTSAQMHHKSIGDPKRQNHECNCRMPTGFEWHNQSQSNQEMKMLHKIWHKAKTKVANKPSNLQPQTGMHSLPRVKPKSMQQLHQMTKIYCISWNISQMFKALVLSPWTESALSLRVHKSSLLTQIKNQCKHPPTPVPPSAPAANTRSKTKLTSANNWCTHPLLLYQPTYNIHSATCGLQRLVNKIHFH